MDSQIPSYLKSLEAVLGASSNGPISTSNPTSVPTLPSFLTSPDLSKGLTTSNAGSTAGKLKLLFVGTHAHQFTGYSKITYGFMKVFAQLPYLVTTHFGFQKQPQLPPNYRPYPPNIRVLDAAAIEAQAQPPNSPPQQGFGYAVLPSVIRQEQPDVVMIYNDLAVISRFLDEIRKSGLNRNFKIWLYTDQVYTYHPQVFIDTINRDADRVFTFTAFWKNCLKDMGVNRPIDILGHGFERETFVPLDRKEVRKRMGLPEDGFIITSLNRNQPRKRYDLLIMAFAELVVKYPTKPIFLLCVCDRGEKGGWWIFEIFTRELKKRNVPIERFGNRLMVANNDMSYRDEDINQFYNVADIGISTAEGEGWGLCNFEQMGVGVPQVVPDVGGFKEFCSATNSVIVKPKHRFYLPSVYSPVSGEAETCDPHDICLGIETYLLDTEKLKKHGDEARRTVLSYTWDKAMKNLLKRLKEENDEEDD